MVKQISSSKTFGGQTIFYEHYSDITRTPMRFGAYIPTAAQHNRVPAIVWLSGLTCTEQNFLTKAGAQRVAEELGIALIAPDTSPRGLDLPGEHDSYDLGSGAGFYLDATEAPWSEHYRMESYITLELLAVVDQALPIDLNRLGISGHSMGGHGALTLAIKHPRTFKSVSAFAPICNPIQSGWGQKAFSTYLGAEQQAWKNYDTVELLKSERLPGPALIDQGYDDEFLAEQLGTKALENVAAAQKHDIRVRYHDGYDHSYYFIATFIEDHLRHHASTL